jgi:hypothetical protein
LSSLLIIWISKQLANLSHAMKGACLGKGHQVTLLSMSIMSHTPKHISQFYNNPFQSLPMSECMSRYYDLVIRRSPKIGLHGNTKTILVVWMARPFIKGTLFNSHPIPKGYAIVHVDKVKPGHRRSKLEYP